MLKEKEYCQESAELFVRRHFMRLLENWEYGSLKAADFIPKCLAVSWTEGR